MSISYVFKCRGCGHLEPLPWLGRCPGCYHFFDAKRVPGENPYGKNLPIEEGQLVSLCDVEGDVKPRTSTLIDGVDHILGKSTLDGSFGFADGQIIMIYGEPGAGKSTLLLQIGQGITKQRYDLIYIAGEESLEQIKERADRIGKFNKHMRIVKETDLDVILDILQDAKPKLFISDSLQTISVGDHLAGTPAAINIASKELQKFAKAESVSAFIVVQVAKSGDFSGPKSVDHVFDSTLYIEKGDGDKRILKCSKNRYGSTDTVVRFIITENGLIETRHEDPDNKDNATYVASPASTTLQKSSHLTSIPLDISTPPIDAFVDNVNTFWTAPDGTTAKAVLAVRCDVPDCHGSIDRACTSVDGKKEAGFHQSRVMKSKLKLVIDAPIVEEKAEEVITKDPFVENVEKTLTAKPRVSKTEKPRVTKKRPKKPTPPKESDT